MSTPVDTLATLHSSSPAVSTTTILETRAPPRLPPSSRQRRSLTWSAPRPLSVRFPVNAAYSLTTPTPPLARSLGRNLIGDQGASSLAAILKETQITSLKCAAAPECLLLCQCPLTHLRTLFPPFLCTFPPASEREHTSSFVPFRTHSFKTFPNTLLVPFFSRTHSLCLACSTSCSRSQTHTHPYSTHTSSTSTRCCPPSCAAWTAATSSCRTGGWRVLPRPSHPPCVRSLRHSLEYNGLGNQAKKAVKDAAGSGVSITF